MNDTMFVRVAQVLRSALLIAMALGLLWLGVELKVVQHQMCDRLNTYGLNEQKQWAKALSQPPPTLPPNPTPAEVAAHQNSIDLRVDFAHNLHNFDPVKC